MATPNREQHLNRAETTLNGAINNSTTSITVTSGAVFPSSGNFRVMVDSEIMVVTARSSNTLTVVRGQDGTSAASHSDLAPIAMIYSYQGFSKLFQDNMGLWGYGSMPAASGVYNDAGTGRLTGGDFTWVNQGSASVATNGDSLTMRCPTDAARNLRMLALTPGGGSWTYIAALRGMAGGDGGCAPHFGLGMRENATGKVIAIGWAASNVNNQKLLLVKWTNSSTLSSTQVEKRCVMNFHIIWFKVEYDGTNVKFYVSPDGVEWILVRSESKTTFFTTAPDEVVWYGCNFENSSTRATELVVSLDHWHKV
jgi:hypothetical protein